ncbi:hypothetical protein [Xanthomonas graminis]|uniref:hypothetical protein n=3 Tax=Xanthomonas graminis TaxID=3390026 RepID=UPI0025439977|nr:hypothetical protein [Xanthomonas translucens]WIH15270.1 hypothetical protein KM433_15600 [Xanthomonas translucens pv. graminis]
MSTTKTRMLRYKKADYLKKGGHDLQSLVQQAVTKLGGVQRREQVDSLAGTRTVLTGVRASSGMLVGKLMLYTPGQQQKFLELDPASQDYKLDALPVGAGKGGAQREFVESILYVAIFERHVMFIGSSSLRSTQLESHRNWLLKEAELLHKEDFLFLEDQQSERTLALLKTNPVKAIEIGGQIEFEEAERVPTRRRAQGRDMEPGYKVMKPVGALAEAAASVFGPIFADASLKSPLKHKEHVWFKMTLSYRNRNKTREGYELMDQLAVFGRHFDGGECVVVLENGGRMAGADIKVATSLSVCSFGRWAAGRTRCLGGHLRMAAVSDPRSSNWGLSMNAYTHHREGAGRNFVAIVLGPVNTNGLSE